MSTQAAPWPAAGLRTTHPSDGSTQPVSSDRPYILPSLKSATAWNESNRAHPERETEPILSEISSEFAPIDAENANWRYAPRLPTFPLPWSGAFFMNHKTLWRLLPSVAATDRDHDCHLTDERS